MTGEWFRFRFPKAMSLRAAEAVSSEHIAEFNRIVAEAQQILASPERLADALAGRTDSILRRIGSHRKRVESIASRLRAIPGELDEEQERMHENLVRAAPGMPAVPAARKPVDSETIIQAWIDERTADNDAPNKESIANNKRKLGRLFAFVGEARGTPCSDLGSITRDELFAYRRYLLPLGIARDHLIDIKALYKVAKRAGLIAKDVAAELVVPAKKKNKRPPFSDREAKAILEAARKAENPVVRWGHWLDAFTTAINSEILLADASEFYQTESGQWVWDMRGRKLKTAYRPRIVSLHPAIIREGFLDHLATRKGKPLFDGSPNVNDAELNELIHSVTLDGKPITKTFYSWRHRLVHRLDKLAGGTLSRFIAGHAAKDIHEQHYHHHELPEFFPEIVTAINKLDDPTR